MKKIILLPLFLLAFINSYGQRELKPLQLRLDAGSSQPLFGIGYHLGGQVRVAEYFSINFKYAANYQSWPGLWVNVEKTIRERALMFGIQPPCSEHWSCFLRLGPGDYRWNETSTLFIFDSDKSSFKGATTAFETGATYEYKAMDVEFLLSATKFSDNDLHPLFAIYGTIGFDLSYFWQKKQSKGNGKNTRHL